MSSAIPMRLLGRTNNNFEVFDTRDHTHRVNHFDVLTYTWGPTVTPYNCGIDGVNWNVNINPRKLKDIKRLMVETNVRYLWVDCLCLNQEDKEEKAVEIPKVCVGAEVISNLSQPHIISQSQCH